jgi:predicted RND superfamily exporter protein
MLLNDPLFAFLVGVLIALGIWRLLGPDGRAHLRFIGYAIIITLGIALVLREFTFG